MARASPAIAALAASLLTTQPAAVAQGASAYHVDRQTAAIILAQQQQPMRQMAGGGRPKAGEPVVVGEQGPEVFVPDQSGTVVPNAEGLAEWGRRINALRESEGDAIGGAHGLPAAAPPPMSPPSGWERIAPGSTPKPELS